MSNNNVNNGVAVSFSMGGMTTRYHLRRQYEEEQNARISQHYSILSPHLGSPVADNVPLATKLLFVSAYAAVWPGWIEEEGGYYIVHHPNFYPSYEMVIVLLGPPIFDAILNATTQPALNDLKTSSSAVNYINPTSGNDYEDSIVKVGIAGTEIDPVVWRLAAGAGGFTEASVLDVVEAVENWKFVNTINALLGFLENQVPLSTLAGYIASYVFVINIDWMWQNGIVQSTESDGIVPKNNQIYPNATALFFPQEVSHMEGRDHTNVIGDLSAAFNIYAPTSPPLSLNINGPTYLGYNETSSFTANASGGSGAYTQYKWWKRDDASGPSSPMLQPEPGVWNYMSSWDGLQTVQTSSPVNFSLKCEVTDSEGNQKTDIHSVTVGGFAKQLSNDQASGLSTIPETLVLQTNYPNPFNPSTTIRFGLPEEQHVKLSIYSVDGRWITTLVDAPLTAGYHNVEWNGHNDNGNRVASGLYIYELTANNQRLIKKMLMLQ